MEVVAADRKGSHDQAGCAAMDPLHPPSTSMVEGDHATTHINRFIGWMVTSTTLMVVWLDGDLTEFTVDDCSRAAYSSCYRSH